jgi:hypothetical protein
VKQIELSLAMENAVGDKFPPLVWMGYDVGVPGLAVCKSPKWKGGVYEETYRKWRIVHVGSGWRVHGVDIPSKALAQAQAVAIGDLADWTRPVQELVLMVGLGDAVREVMGGNSKS